MPTYPLLLPMQYLQYTDIEDGPLTLIFHTEFAACATNRTFSAPFMCRAERRKMNTCMMQFANQTEQDLAREEWFATRDLRKKEREEKEEKRIEQEKFHREWWGLDEEGKRIAKDPKGGQ